MTCRASASSPANTVLPEPSTPSTPTRTQSWPLVVGTSSATRVTSWARSRWGSSRSVELVDTWTSSHRFRAIGLALAALAPGHRLHAGRDLGGHARSRLCLYFCGVMHLAAGGAHGPLGDSAATYRMGVKNGWAVRGRPPVAPFGECEQDGHQLAPLDGEQVLVQVRILGVAAPLHDSGVHQAVEAGAEGVRRDAEALAEVVEAGHAREQRIAHDQQAPSLAYNLE